MQQENTKQVLLPLTAMYPEVRRSSMSLRSHLGSFDGTSRWSNSNTAEAEESRIPCRCSWVLCVVVTFIVLTVVACVITVPLIPDQRSLHSAQVGFFCVVSPESVCLCIIAMAFKILDQWTLQSAQVG